jgi:carbon storage regulator
MLVLTRSRDESIMIGQDVEVTIVDVRGNSVRLGINAPKSIPVHRREVFNAIHEQELDERSSKSSVG